MSPLGKKPPGRSTPPQGSPRIQLAYSIPVPIGRQGSAEVEIQVSTRRRNSSHAHLEAGKVVVVVPAALSEREREEVAARLARRILEPSRAKTASSDAELARRAAELGTRYLDGVVPSSIRWVDNQTRRWGSCTPSRGTIRLSSRLAGMPGFVLDAVIIHELAHLIEPSHSPRFRELCDRYPRSGEADAYLLGFEHGATTAGMPLGPLPAESWQSAGPGQRGCGDVETARKEAPDSFSAERFSQLSFR